MVENILELILNVVRLSVLDNICMENVDKGESSFNTEKEV